MAAALIAGRFELVAKIGQGSFGDLFQGVDREERGADVAVKLEHVRSAKPQLRHEHGVYQSLAGAQGFAQARWYGAEGDFRVLVLDLLGPNLQQLLAFCGGRFSLKTVLMLADQMIARLETLHDRGVIHCDVKPHNFLMGLPDTPSADTVFLVDMGLAHFYLDPATGKHCECVRKNSMTGTLRYASVSNQSGYVQGRRDDLESLLYVLLFLLSGDLPWSGVSASTPLQKEQRVLDIKFRTPPEVLCADAPPEFAEFLKRCRGLGFEERPPYDQLRALFQSRFDAEGFVRDGVWDWTLVRLKIFEDSLVERAWEQSCCHKR